jgi:hypothetical protein
MNFFRLELLQNRLVASTEVVYGLSRRKIKCIQNIKYL